MRPSTGAVIALLTASVLAPQPAVTANWPTKPVFLVVPFAPGGAADVFARLLADPLAKELKQPVVVEDRGGAGGLLGAGQGARATPDGYTLLLGGLAPQVIAPAINPNSGFDPLRDLPKSPMAADRRSAGSSHRRRICTPSTMCSIAPEPVPCRAMQQPAWAHSVIL